MNEQDAARARRARYREMIREYPWLAANQPGGFEILTSDEDMDAAEAAHWSEFRAARDADPKLAATTEGASIEWFRVGVALEDAYIVVLRDAVRTPNGKLVTYLRVYNRFDKGPGAAILARKEGKFVLVRHHRHALRAFLHEVPRGFSRPQENCEQTAARQLREEIQGTVEHLVPLGEIHPDGGKLGDAVCAAFAELSQIGQTERGEAITGYELVDEKDLSRRIADGEVTDAFTLSLYAKAVARGLIKP